MTIIGFKNLPKKAQREIERLRADVEFWKAKALAATSEDSEATNVVLHNVLESDRGLPSNSIIVFRLGHHGRSRSIEVRHEHGMLAIRSTDGMLSVRPAAANVIHVQPEE